MSHRDKLCCELLTLATDSPTVLEVFVALERVSTYFSLRGILTHNLLISVRVVASPSREIGRSCPWLACRVVGRDPSSARLTPTKVASRVNGNEVNDNG